MSDLPIFNPLVLIGVGSSFAFSGLFYHLYKEKKDEMVKLKEIPKFIPDQHLVRILKASPHRKLQYVAVEGLVQADGETLASQFVPRCFGVIQKIAVEEHWKVWNNITRTWNSRMTNRKETNNAVPFSLVEPGAYISDITVKVHSPLEASGWFLERVHCSVKHAQEGLVDVLLEGLSGERPMAQKETEELLRVGTTMTGFGEVVLEGGTGTTMRLQAPQDGRRYILVPTDYKGFIERHEGTANLWKRLTALFGITGASLLAGAVYSTMGKKDKRD
ncbi:mitochondrial ubiquitin ligase activator of nfkb 1-A [Salmo trutta]|uniref:RING-type E3 ubiquitin transferase n=1 Tax=Salmo trutta TaxID=8032 RepID=A0A674BF76_SALTR|nr:mitochondrial ubiquitin ligase activator of nfkb 1-A-like [Salmo trutta]